MRLQAINVATFYMVVGSLLNAAACLLIFPLSISFQEQILTLMSINGCYIFVARDFMKHHEIKAANKFRKS